MIKQQKQKLVITCPGAEAEYVATLAALVNAIKNASCPDERTSLANLLLAMLPGEEQVKLE